MGKDREIGFSTFVKLVALPLKKQESTLRGFLSGGGYDYWRPLRELAVPAIAGEIDIMDMGFWVSKYAKAHQLKYNTSALTTLTRWITQRSLVLRKNDVYLVKQFGNAGLKVRLAPELALSRGNKKIYVHVWATNNPVLTDVSLSMGLRFFELHAHQSLEEDFECAIFDAVKGRMFSEMEILANADEHLSAQQEQLSALWNEVSGSTKSSKNAHLPDAHPKPPL